MSIDMQKLCKELFNWIRTSNSDDYILEIRKLDSQLDHLNDYMSKMEERLKLHNEKLMETLRHQKEEREKRRRSFHEVSAPFFMFMNFSS